MEKTSEQVLPRQTGDGGPARDSRAARAARPVSRRLLGSARLAPALATALAIALAALALWLIAGVGFVNYDTLYGLVWGAQLARGETPQYGLPIAPTPHPLVELLGIPLAPLGAGAGTAIVVALAFLALAASAWLVYRIGSEWFGRAAGAVAALALLTRVPVLSYGVRAYVDVPYMLFVLAALLVETRRRRAGAPVLVLLALAGLLRPEAWAFSALYWLYLALPARRSRRSLAHSPSHPSPPHPPSRSPPAHSPSDPSCPTSPSHPPRSRRELAWLALLAASAPLIWIASDLLVTGDAMWSLTNTKHTAATLGRATGIGDVPEYVPRRIGEVLRPAVLAGAALGGVLSLLWLRSRAALGAVAGVAAVLVFAAMASAGLPIDTRYAFLTGAILCVFCGAGAFGWTALPRGDRRRTVWMAAGGVIVVALLATLPGQVRSAHRELAKLARQQTIQSDLTALVHSHAIALRCGPVGVPNHAPIPLLALYLKAPPSRVVSAEAAPIGRGVYVDPASLEVQREYILDPRDPHSQVSIPPGFTEAATNSSWLIFRRCE